MWQMYKMLTVSTQIHLSVPKKILNLRRPVDQMISVFVIA
jgi:hypothetical protein